MSLFIVLLINIPKIYVFVESQKVMPVFRGNDWISIFFVWFIFDILVEREN
jgi:hypothetical protein